MAKKIKPLVIAPTPAQALAAERNTDWEIAQANGTNRYGRRYLGHRVHGAGKTKRAHSARACRGRVES